MTLRSLIHSALPAIATAGLLVLGLAWWTHGRPRSQSSITVQLPAAREMPKPGFSFDPKR